MWMHHPGGPNSGTQDADPPAEAILLVLVVFLAGMANNWGFFSWRGLILLLAALVLAIRFHLKPPALRLSADTLLGGLLVAFVAVGCVLRAGQQQQMVQYALPGVPVAKWRLTAPGTAIKVLNAAALLVALAWVLRVKERAAAYLVGALVVFAVAMRVLMLFSTPLPRIDMFISQTAAGKGLLEGGNVYAMEFPSPYVRGESFDHYAYPPAVVYCNALSWALFKDVRAVWLGCDLLGALFLYLLARRVSPSWEGRRYGALLALGFLFMPRSLFVIEQSFTEPLIVASLGAFAWALAAGKGTGVVGLLLGLWLGSKQYVAVAVPLVVRLGRCRLRAWAVAGVVVIGLFVPFLLWDFPALYEDLMGFFIKSPGRVDSLSLYGVAARLRHEPPWWVILAAWLAGIGFFTWKMRRTLAGWLFSTASCWMFFFMLGKQAVINYFYVIAYTLLLAAAAVRVGGRADRPAAAAETGAWRKGVRRERRRTPSRPARAGALLHGTVLQVAFGREATRRCLEDPFLGRLGDAELQRPLGRDLDGLAGPGITAHPGLAVHHH